MKTLDDHATEQIKNLNNDIKKEEVVFNRVIPTWWTIQDKFDKLWQYRITLIQRNDKRKHWRLWLNKEWIKEDIYLIEQPTIEQCLDRAIRFIETGQA